MTALVSYLLGQAAVFRPQVRVPGPFLNGSAADSAWAV